MRMMTAQEYLDTYQGQSLLYNQSDPSLRGQCVQGVCFYVDANGKPVIWADAYVWWSGNQYPDAYERIPNTPDAVPQAGDIIIWGPTLPGSGGAGHIAVCLQPFPGTGTFESVDQNWGGKTVHKVTHTYAYVVGWLRFKNAAAPAPAPAPSEGDEMITTAEQATQLYKMLRPNYSGPTQGELDATVNKRTFAQFLNDAQAEIATRDAHFSAEEQQLVTDSNEIGQLTQTIAQLKAAQDQPAAQPAAASAPQNQATAAKPNPVWSFVSWLLRIKKP